MNFGKARSWRLVVTVLAAGLSVPLLFLRFTQPYLWRAVVDDPFGFRLVRVVVSLVTAGVTLQVLAVSLHSRFARDMLAVATFVLITLPALLMVVFEPIVFVVNAAPPP